MKLTTKQLKRIIKEELNKIMNEGAYQAGMAAGAAGDNYDDSAWPGEEDNYEAGYYDGQRSEDPESPFGSDSDDGDEEPQQAVKRMAQNAVKAYTEKHSNLAPFPPGLLKIVVQGALWYLENQGPTNIEDRIEELVDTYARFPDSKG